MLTLGGILGEIERGRDTGRGRLKGEFLVIKV
jgi:hypothetical protein